MVKCLPGMWETRVWSLGWEDPLEKEMATHASTLAWKIGRLLSPWGHKELDMTEWLHLHISEVKSLTNSPRGPWEKTARCHLCYSPRKTPLQSGPGHWKAPGEKGTDESTMFECFEKNTDRLTENFWDNNYRYRGFPGGWDGKESVCNLGDPGLVPGSGRAPGVGSGNQLRYSWRIPWTNQPGGLQSMGSQRVGHDCGTKHLMIDTWEKRAKIKKGKKKNYHVKS